MTMRVPEEPILAAPVEVLPVAGSFEPKWDGFRVLLSRAADGAVDLRSRRGTRLVPAFGDIAAAAERDLPRGVVLDGEVVVWHGGRLAFDLLQRRMHRTAASAAREARAYPANLVAFDLLGEDDQDLMALPYAQRRARLEAFFAAHRLGPPWVLCPATTDRAEAELWMRDWAPAGIEGLVVKDPGQRYRPGQRGWRKYRVRDTTEVLVGAVAGSLARPTTALFGRFDDAGVLRFVGRSTVLDSRARAVLAGRVRAAAPDHPWHGRSFSAAWGSRERHPMIPVAPDVVAEVAVDAAFERGAWRHPIRVLRLREDLAPGDVPKFGQGPAPAAG
ncbi:ATP-dependent DNA ligase [Streptodolium elevatio]|uniref:ATP-dependent DNA ligase n=1 Tax=Streptodolium elevatio TaxID=3157996 RepID=A0ABV3DY16_9ACTN